MDGATIKRRLKARGLTQADLAGHMGVSKWSMLRLLNGERDITAAEARAIDTFFDADDPLGAPPPGRVPVYGYAAGASEDRVAIASDQVLEFVAAPEIEGEARVDFGVRVAGESMAPRLFAGETVFVRRNLPPAKGKDCVVELTDGTAMVKAYEGRRDGFIFLRQYNPEEIIRLPWSEVRAIHAVVLRD